MTHECASNPLALICWQGSDGIDIGRPEQREIFRLEPRRRRHRMTDHLVLPIRQHVDATARDVGKEVIKIFLLMGCSADMNDGSPGLRVQFFRPCRRDHDCFTHANATCLSILCVRERAPTALRSTLPDYIKRSTAEYIQSGLCSRWQFRSPSSLWKRKELRLKTMVLERISSGVWTKKRSHAATKSYSTINNTTSSLF